MPDDRFLHRCQGFSHKLSKLDHLAYRVWTQYLLSADDFGVCPDSPSLIRGANLALAQESEDAIRSALDDIVEIGLVARFEHQEQEYLCSLDWQDYQSIRYPRTSYYPVPPAETLRKLSRKTAELFKKHSRGTVPASATRGRANPRLTANGSVRTEDPVQTDVPEKGDSGDPTIAFREAWDEHPHTPKVLKWTEERIATIRRRLKEGHDLMRVLGAFDHSAFLAGTRGRDEGHESFRATVDWCLKPKNLMKILEGAYADPTATAPGPSREEAERQRVMADAKRIYDERMARSHNT